MTDTFAQTVAALSRSAELSILVKATFALAVGLVAAGLAGRAKASIRHVLLASTFGALLALPIVIAAAPALAVELRVAAPSDRPMPGSGPRAVSGGGTLSAATGADATAASSGDSPIGWGTIARFVWMAGAMWLLASLLVAVWRLGRLTRTGLPWPEMHARLRLMAKEAGIARPVDLLLHEQIAAPLTCGVLRPTILLPIDARQWDEASLRRALVHELEHVRRRDWAVQIAARAACAVYWFHPLAWIAWRQLCLEAERACDDAVLQGQDQTDYAEQLVELAARLAHAPEHSVVAMASRSDLSARVSALLDATLPRGRAGTWRSVTALLAAAALVLTIAPLRAVVVSSAVGAAAPAAEQPKVLPPHLEAWGQPQRVRGLDRALYEAAEQGDLDDITQLVGAGANVNAAIHGDGSPLIGAARAGRRAAVRLLLDRGADPNMPVSGDGSPLIVAASEGHPDIVTMLLDSGASIDQMVEGDENALIQASGEGHLPVVKLLVSRGADVNARAWAGSAFDRTGEWRTPLRMARQARHAEVVAFLIASGAHE